MTTRQPDDPGIDIMHDAPVRFGVRYAELTPMTLKVIRRNAGRVPPLTLARALCWRMTRLQRIAADHGINLRLPTDKEPSGA